MSFEDYDKLHIYCSVYFASFGKGHWKFSVSWYNAEGEITSSNFGEAPSRPEANKNVLELAELIKDRNYNHAPK